MLGVSQSKLQDIVFQIINKKYTPTNIVNLGGASGVQTTRKGTPDVFIQLSNGDYIYIEVTIQKDALVKKIKKDIEKCKENAGKLCKENAGVEKVIFVCIGKINTFELQECQNLCKEFCLDTKTPFEFWGIDKLSALLLHEYQFIAVSELSIKFSHGLIKTLDEHLREDKYDVSQKHEFLFRENELADIENKLLDKNIVLLRGDAGCGKTRLCMYLAQKLKQSGLIKEVYYVKNAYYNGFDSICTAVGQEKTAIILDDVNRLPFIKEFITYVQNHRNIYVLATVRNYAFNSIFTDLKNNNFENCLHFIEVAPLTTEQQEKIIKKIIPGATYDTLTAIHNVAHANLRFAIMMAETLKKHGYLPNKMKDLMERHFHQINEDLEKAITKDSNIIYIKSLVLLAIFHRIVVDEENRNWIFISEALSEIGINRDDFHDAMAYWDRQEVINIGYEGKVYEIGDQILSSYLFYKLVFEEKQITLRKLFDLFFPQYKKCFIDMFNSILPAYGYQNEAIMWQIEQLWIDYYKIKNDDDSIQYINMFFGLLPIETLDFIKSQGFPLSESFIDILCAFESSPYNNIAIDLLLEDIDKGHSKRNMVEKIPEAFCIHKNSFSNNLDAQMYLLKKLNDRIVKSDIYYKIFLELSKKLLDVTFHSTIVNFNSMVCFTIEATPCNCLLDMRATIWEGLKRLYEVGHYKDLISLLNNFRFIPNSKRIDKLKEIFDNDQRIILPFVGAETKKNPTFAQKLTLKALLESCCSDNNLSYQKILSSLESQSVDFMIYSQAFSRKRDERIDWKQRTTRYDNIFKTITLPGDFHSYLFALQSIDTEINTISFAAEAYLKYIDKYYPKLFVEYLKKFVLEFKNINISYTTISHIVAKYDLKEFIAFIRASSIPNKGIVLLELLENLKQQEISEDLYELCIKIFREEYCTTDTIAPRIIKLSGFFEYEKFRSGFFLTIFEIIQNSKNANINKYNIVEDFYYADTNRWSYQDLSLGQIEISFGDKLEPVFYEMFFVLMKSKLLYTSSDFIRHIAKKNIEYLYRYYDLCFDLNNRFSMADNLDLKVLSEFPNVPENILIIHERSKSLLKYLFPIHEMIEILSKNLTDKTFSEFAALFINKYATEVDDLRYMTGCVSSLKSEWQILFAQAIIAKNIGVEIFEKINVFSFPSSWSGSDVAMYGKIIETIDIFLNETSLTTQNMSYILCIKEKRNKLVTYQAKARLRELSDYNFYS